MYVYVEFQEGKRAFRFKSFADRLKNVIKIYKARKVFAPPSVETFMEEDWKIDNNGTEKWF